ncbi:phage terminase large subunit family protein [Pantoea sp. ME81]|uniref:phage terminase large subunit family protein n=1 Tax=Pantoea sp. ME81 TaxID=2743935 RepID=UPI00351AE6C3
MGGQRLTLFEFQKEPLDIITNPRIRKVVLQSSAQLLKTTVMLNAAMYFMANDNSNMAFASSTGKEVKLMKTGKFDNVIARSEVLWSDPEPIDKSALYFEHRRSLWAHHDLPLSLKKKPSARSPSGAIPSPTFLNAWASRNTAFINGSAL